MRFHAVSLAYDPSVALCQNLFVEHKDGDMKASPFLPFSDLLNLSKQQHLYFRSAYLEHVLFPVIHFNHIHFPRYPVLFPGLWEIPTQLYPRAMLQLVYLLSDIRHVTRVVGEIMFMLSDKAVQNRIEEKKANLL